LKHNFNLKKLSCSTPVTVIHGRPIASEDIIEESEEVCVVLGNLAYVISFNIIHSPEHLIILGLPWFELHNLDIDWINQAIIRPPKNLTSSLCQVMNSSPNPHHISIISLQRFAERNQELTNVHICNGSHTFFKLAEI
jgi:hypothetical protein